MLPEQNHRSLLQRNVDKLRRRKGWGACGRHKARKKFCDCYGSRVELERLARQLFSDTVAGPSLPSSSRQDEPASSSSQSDRVDGRHHGAKELAHVESPVFHAEIDDSNLDDDDEDSDLDDDDDDHDDPS